MPVSLLLTIGEPAIGERIASFNRMLPGWRGGPGDALRLWERWLHDLEREEGPVEVLRHTVPCDAPYHPLTGTGDGGGRRRDPELVVDVFLRHRFSGPRRSQMVLRLRGRPSTPRRKYKCRTPYAEWDVRLDDPRAPQRLKDAIREVYRWLRSYRPCVFAVAEHECCGRASEPESTCCAFHDVSVSLLRHLNDGRGCPEPPLR